MKVLMVPSGNLFQKNTSVTWLNLEFSVYDAVAHYNIRMKALIFLWET